jgi:Predicted integral membrane protein (DUF2269)
VQDEIRHRVPAIAASVRSVYTSFMQRFARQAGVIAAIHRLVHVVLRPLAAGGCDLRHSAPCGLGRLSLHFASDPHPAALGPLAHRTCRVSAWREVVARHLYSLRIRRRLLASRGLAADPHARSPGAAVRDGTALPPRYHRYMQIWFILGWPAFSAVIAIFYLMVAKPS